MPFDERTHTPVPYPDKAAGLQRQAEAASLGDAIAELSARIQAATFELLVMIRQFDERGGWGQGFMSCAHWLNWRTGLAMWASREKVRVARALGELPQFSDAMRRGALSYSKVRALTRVATPETEERLLDFARCATAAHVERLVRAWRRVDRVAEAEDDRRRHASRHLDVWVDEDGMLVVRGRLSPEVGAVVQRALEAAGEQLYRESQDEVPATGSAREQDPTSSPTVGQRRADALGLIAESALTAHLDRGTTGDRYQVVVHVDADGLADNEDGGQAAARGRPAGGQGVPAAIVPAAFDRRCMPVRLCCSSRRILPGRHRPGRLGQQGASPDSVQRGVPRRTAKARALGVSRDKVGLPAVVSLPPPFSSHVTDPAVAPPTGTWAQAASVDRDAARKNAFPPCRSGVQTAGHRGAVRELHARSTDSFNGRDASRDPRRTRPG